MIVINLIIALVFIMALALLCGKKLMFSASYMVFGNQVLILCVCMINLINSYRQGDMSATFIVVFGILMLSISIWGYRRNRYTYSIINISQDEVIEIICNYLEKKNIRYEVSQGEIYLIDSGKEIYIRGEIEITLKLKQLKGMEIYNELIGEIKVGIKETKKKYFSVQGWFYLIIAMFLYWLKVNLPNII